jgi:hypothetical protein
MAAFRVQRRQRQLKKSARENGQAHSWMPSSARRHEICSDRSCVAQSIAPKSDAGVASKPSGAGRKSAARMVFHLLQYDKAGAPHNRSGA